MTKILLVGDPHATQNELADCQRLLDLVAETKAKFNPKYTIWLGDLHHNHSLVHLQVMDFWRKNLHKDDILLPGNHDMSGDDNTGVHALLAYSDIATVINSPTVIDEYYLVPYMYDKEEFVKVCNAHPDKVLICHETFLGAKYETGIYAHDAVDLRRIESNEVISGHIHTPQVVEKATYIGAPRWRTISDANTDRYIVIKDGSSVIKIPTSTHCMPMYSYSVKEGEEIPVVDSRGKVSIDLHGSEEWIEKIKSSISGEVRIRTFPVSKPSGEVSEAIGIDKAFADFVSKYETKSDKVKILDVFRDIMT